MRNLSQRMIDAMYAQDTAEVVVFLCELSREGDSEPIRLCNDSADITHQGEVYTAYPFTIILPEDDSETVPLPRWVASNASLDLVNVLRRSTLPIDVTVKVVLAATPDQSEIEFDAVIYGAQIDVETVSGTMSVEPIMDEPFSRLSFTPENNPGLFP